MRSPGWLNQRNGPETASSCQLSPQMLEQFEQRPLSGCEALCRRPVSPVSGMESRSYRKPHGENTLQVLSWPPVEICLTERREPDKLCAVRPQLRAISQFGGTDSLGVPYLSFASYIGGTCRAFVAFTHPAKKRSYAVTVPASLTWEDYAADSHRTPAVSFRLEQLEPRAMLSGNPRRLGGWDGSPRRLLPPRIGYNPTSAFSGMRTNALG